jgi:hypothetical protein
MLARFVILLAAFPAISGAGAEDKGEGAPLFHSNDLLEVTISAPFREIMRVRSQDEEQQGTISYRDDSGAEVVLDIGVRTRGRYRHQRNVCPFAPIRLNFRKTKDTLFAKSDKMKLVTHCKNKIGSYQQSLLREYLAYRILNVLTDKSFRVRLMKIKYVESTDGQVVEDNYGFLIEHRDQLGKRIGLDYNPVTRIQVSALDPGHTNLVSVFQYLIGNTDFSPVKGTENEPCCHNYILMGSEPGNVLSIPYDFDISGIVSAPYATPNPRFKLSDVRERLYRGRCGNNDYLAQSVQLFQEKRQNIYDLIDELPDFSYTSRTKTDKYIDDFYKTIDSPKKVERRLTRKCIE